MKYISISIFMLIQLYVLFLTYYYNAISIFGLKKVKEEEDKLPEKSFAVAIAAHNEEKVIGQILDNLKELDYPKELYDVFVICDNCEDNTAKIVKEKKITALERFDSDKRGKGYALKWFFDLMFKMKRQYDAVVIFDADNLVTKNFLTKMNNNLLSGKEVIQGYLDSKNPDDSWVTISYALAYWITNRNFQLARKRLKLNAALGGTGFCLSTRVLKEFGWNAMSLTEDLEFTMICTLNDIPVVWEHTAKIYDEKPVTMKASLRQRIRWLQGHWDCCFRYSGPLLRRAFGKGKFACFDAFVYLIQPSKMILDAFSFTMLMAKLVFPSVPILKIVFPLWFWVLALFFRYAVPVAALLLEGVSLKRMMAIVIYPIYGVTWIPVSVIGLFKKNKKEWNHTLHDRVLEEEHLEAAITKKKI
ncbi:glycosyltransferase family 2 protein [Clostridium sp. YIM B02515]|uniref:Glycosyltransferase family 2 protein n=1 Tax=Clostridium rhizosphaerae TaxID=2803861 RepID=A0ABS1TC73_9CLOT|nr:glycosyltransferase family 2 protein [Clostridium rhizosphaerae]MBL4936866.1 glycosyltransferase family 2 protein [Clostridium rhizosphaerae]